MYDTVIMSLPLKFVFRILTNTSKYLSRHRHFFVFNHKAIRYLCRKFHLYPNLLVEISHPKTTIVHVQHRCDHSRLRWATMYMIVARASPVRTPLAYEDVSAPIRKCIHW